MKRTRDDLINSLPDITAEAKPVSFYLPKKAPLKLKLINAQDSLTEDQVIATCLKWLKLQGWVCKRVYTGGVPLGNGRLAPNPCKGIPDFICFHFLTSQLVWIEFKKGMGGLVSQEQQEWHEALKRVRQKILVINSLAKLKEELSNSHT